MEPPHQLVSPTGVLHLVPSDNKGKKAFCDAHKLRPAYLNLHIRGPEEYREHGGWQRLDKVRYLQQVSSGVIVVVVGKPKQFYDIRTDACERAGLDCKHTARNSPRESSRPSRSL